MKFRHLLLHLVAGSACVLDLIGVALGHSLSRDQQLVWLSALLGWILIAGMWQHLAVGYREDVQKLRAHRDQLMNRQRGWLLQRDRPGKS